MQIDAFLYPGLDGSGTNQKATDQTVYFAFLIMGWQLQDMHKTDPVFSCNMCRDIGGFFFQNFRHFRIRSHHRIEKMELLFDPVERRNRLQFIPYVIVVGYFFKQGTEIVYFNYYRSSYRNCL